MKSTCKHICLIYFIKIKQSLPALVSDYNTGVLDDHFCVFCVFFCSLAFLSLDLIE